MGINSLAESLVVYSPLSATIMSVSNKVKNMDLSFNMTRNLINKNRRRKMLFGIAPIEESDVVFLSFA